MVEANGYLDYGDAAYMEQEEEWEREGLLDPAWEKQQKKVITIFLTHFTYLIFLLQQVWVQFIGLVCSVCRTTSNS